jgi:hypothetical protein
MKFMLKQRIIFVKNTIKNSLNYLKLKNMINFNMSKKRTKYLQIAIF